MIMGGPPYFDHLGPVSWGLICAMVCSAAASMCMSSQSWGRQWCTVLTYLSARCQGVLCKPVCPCTTSLTTQLEESGVGEKEPWPSARTCGLCSNIYLCEDLKQLLIWCLQWAYFTQWQEARKQFWSFLVEIRKSPTYKHVLHKEMHVNKSTRLYSQIWTI